MTHSLPPLLSLTPPLLTSSLTNGLSSLCSLPQSSFSSLAHTTTLTLHSPLISLSPIDPVGTPGASMTPFLPPFPFLTLTVRPSTLDPRPPTLDPRTSNLEPRTSRPASVAQAGGFGGRNQRTGRKSDEGGKWKNGFFSCWPCLGGRPRHGNERKVRSSP